MVWLVVALAVSVLLIVLFTRDFGSGILPHWAYEAIALATIAAILAALVLTVAIAVVGYGMVAASHQADFINKQYGTDFTAAEVYYAGADIRAHGYQAAKDRGIIRRK